MKIVCIAFVAVIALSEIAWATIPDENSPEWDARKMAFAAAMKEEGHSQKATEEFETNSRISVDASERFSDIRVQTGVNCATVTVAVPLLADLKIKVCAPENGSLCLSSNMNLCNPTQSAQGFLNHREMVRIGGQQVHVEFYTFATTPVRQVCGRAYVLVEPSSDCTDMN